jgi:hypothetical protein
MLLPLIILGFCFVTVWLGPRSHRGGHWVAVFSTFATYVFSKGGVLGFYIFDVSALRGVLQGIGFKTFGDVFFQTLPPTKK